MIVLDSSAVVEWLLLREGAATVSERLCDADVSVHAPSILGVEVAAALRGLVLGRQATEQRAATALSDLLDAGIALHDPSPLLRRAWELRDARPGFVCTLT